VFTLRIGYLFRGFLADVKLGPDLSEVSTPDGNATYSWCIEHELNRRRHQLIPLGTNMDAPGAMTMGEDIFCAFSREKRIASYERMLRRGWTRLSDRRFPELDAVIIEWRWPIPGRNTPEDRGLVGYQNDLERQLDVLREYSSRGTPIIVWDLDHKLTEEDERHWGFDVIETAVIPRRDHVRVDPPCVTSELLQFDIDECMPSHHLGYIGSRYERDETIDRWISPIAPANTHRVKFWGKWEPADEVRARWPGVSFSGRIGVRGFRDAYSRVAAVPLLAKQSYYDCGFVTPRAAEAVMFGSVPIGLGCHTGIQDYVPFVAGRPEALIEQAVAYRTMSPIRRRVLREEAAHILYRTDVRGFADVIEGLVGEAGAG
jgi:hypothetical protein